MLLSPTSPDPLTRLSSIRFDLSLVAWAREGREEDGSFKAPGCGSTTPAAAWQREVGVRPFRSREGKLSPRKRIQLVKIDTFSREPLIGDMLVVMPLRNMKL